MKLKDIFNKENIKSFIEGNLTYFKKELGGLEPHIEEQIAYRLALCHDDCVATGECKYCGCPTHKKALVKKSCNKGERFPDMMNKEDWKQYKKENEIE